MKKIRVISSAEQDILDAADYYEHQAKGLASDFYDAVEQCSLEIAQRSDAWPLVNASLRKRTLSRFPFFILYRVDADKIVIQAVVHMRRNPDRWLSRIR